MVMGGAGTVLFNVDVLFLWLGAIIFVGAMSIGLVRGALSQTFAASLLGIMILTVGTVGPEKKDELSKGESVRMHQQCLVAGHYSFLLAVVVGGMWLMYTVWNEGQAVPIAVYLAVIQIPYLAIRVMLRKSAAGRKSQGKKR
ncbi:MAG: hypothetical protein R6U70_04550 [Bacillota bacterium]